jgi:hypothetical protein
MRHEFVEFVPDQLKEGVVYICIQFATAVHRCCCGCGREVVTPISRADWTLSFDGESISLDPSIGNWSYPCQSHYWIRKNRVQWTPRWSPEMIERGRKKDRLLREQVFDGRYIDSRTAELSDANSNSNIKTRWSLWRRVIGRLFS